MLVLYTILIILAILLLLVAVILLLPLRLTIEYKDDLRFSFSLLRIFRWQYPKKKKKVKLSRYSPKAVRKREQRELRKRRRMQARMQKKRQKKKPAETKKEAPKKRESLDVVLSVFQSLPSILARGAKHIRIEMHRLLLSVATEDAAKTAILFGTVNQAAAAFLLLLEETNTVRYLKHSQISVQPDFTAQKSTVDLRITVILRPWHLLDVLFHARLPLAELLSCVSPDRK